MISKSFFRGVFIFLSLILYVSYSTFSQNVIQSTPVFEDDNNQVITELERQRPEWIDIVPASEDYLFFVGCSKPYATEREARLSAEQDGRKQFLDYCRFIARTNNSHEIQNSFNGMTIQVQGLVPWEYYTELSTDTSNASVYEVYVLMRIEKSTVQQILDKISQEQAEQDALRRQMLEEIAEFFSRDDVRLLLDSEENKNE